MSNKMNFEQKVKKSFKRVKNDNESIQLAINILNKDLNSIKTNSNDWIMYLMKENNVLKNALEKLTLEINQLKQIQLRNF